MFATFRNAWKVTELRSKILFTLLVLFIYRLGAQIPVPYISSELIESATMFTNGSIFAYMNILSGGAFGQATLFALSVSPYITAQIIVQLLTVAIPALERMSKDGEEGRRKITAITRYATVALSLITAYGYMLYMQDYLVEGVNWFGKLVIVLCYCAGSSVIMWLAEKINDHGIGNGISMILFANIISRGPSLVIQLIDMAFPGFSSFDWLGLIFMILSIAITLAVVVLVVWFTESERRIPIQYAKRVVGRKMYGGQSSNLPIKLNMTGVMPVIFASSIVSIPATIASFFPNSNFWKGVNEVFNYDGWLYLVIYLVLIIAFAYFYVLISFNPVEVANNIQKNGGSIPGIRSGRPTVQHIKKILNRITLIGAIFLCFIAGFPMIINIITSALGTSFAGLAFGGNSLLIVVGVALETHRDLEAQLALRSYGGSKSKGIFG
jgi:preprotein translocase subunit SecY